MLDQRRNFLKVTAFGAASLVLAEHNSGNARAEEVSKDRLPKHPIIDTHQHLWSTSPKMPPWLNGAGEILRQNYQTQQYRKATAGLDISAVYMEVDMGADDLIYEVDKIEQLIQSGNSLTRAAVVGGRPADPGFQDYLDHFQGSPLIKGVRQVLHGSTPRGYCLQDDFVSGIRELGKRNLSFDLCMRPEDLGDAEKLASTVPNTRFILDHCGNADVNAFKPGAAKASHDINQWKRDIEKLASHENVDCKISGIIAKAKPGWQPSDLAPIVNHCLDSFGPERVVFGGDWPVCLLGASFLEWTAALNEIISSRPEKEQIALWSENAKRVYRL